jgi:hypothetical protein
MPRRLSPAEVALRAKLAEIKAQLTATRDAEKPLRDARTKLVRSLTGHAAKCRKFASKVEQELRFNVISGGMHIYQLEKAEGFLRDAQAGFKSASLNLHVFDAVHQIEPEKPYPTVPTVDRAQVEAEARAFKEASLREFRARHHVRG